MEETRKLSTILFVDIAGYTAIMQSNESKALAYLQIFKNTLELIVSKYQGHIVQYFGDGCLISFESTSQGVRSAIALQEAFRKDALPVRVGMHLGEVLFRENNIFGDGVNIASRIESMGVPGAILLSKAVRDQIKNKSEFELSSLGTFDFKNVNEPMEVYAITNPGFTIPPREELKGKFNNSAKKKELTWANPVAVGGLVFGAIIILSYILVTVLNTSKGQAENSVEQKGIAVMPFQNLSPDNNDLFYCNGIMQNVIDNLSRIPELIVLPSRTTNLYRNTDLLPKELGEELGVQYIIDGTFQKIDSQIQVTIALTSTHDGRQIWTNENVTFSLPELFSMQAQIANQVASQLKTSPNSDLIKTLEALPTKDENAYEYYLMGNEKLRGINYQTNTNSTNLILLNEAKLLFNLAIERDTNFANAYLGLARTEYTDNESSHNQFFRDSSMFQYERLVNKALKLNPELSEGYYMKGKYYLYSLHLPDEAEKYWLKALEKNPNNLQALKSIADLYMGEKLDITKGVRLLKEIEYRTIDEEELYEIYFNLSRAYSKIMDLKMEWHYLEKCMKLDNSASDLAVPWYYLRTGQPEKALAELNKRYPNKNNQFQLVLHGLYNNFNGKFSEAIKYYEQWENLLDFQSEDNWFSINDWHRYGQALVSIGEKHRGLELMRRQISINKQRIKNNPSGLESYYDMAGIYSFMNMPDSAHFYLKTFQEAGGFLKGWGLGSFIRVDYQFDNIRSDEKFTKIFEAEKARMHEIRSRVSSVDPEARNID